MYTYASIYLSICQHTYRFIHIYQSVYLSRSISSDTFISISPYLYIYISTCIHVFTFTYTHTHTTPTPTLTLTRPPRESIHGRFYICEMWLWFNGNCQHGGELCVNIWTTCMHIYIQGGCLLQWLALCCRRCSVLQRVALCSSVLQCVAVCCSAPYLPRKYTQKIQMAKTAGNSVEAVAAMHSVPRLDYICIFFQKTWSLSNWHTCFVFPDTQKLVQKIYSDLHGDFNGQLCCELTLLFWILSCSRDPKNQWQLPVKILNVKLDGDLYGTFSGTLSRGLDVVVPGFKLHVSYIWISTSFCLR